ncbi:hypothetical protein [Vibrio genomosp. F10]|uniref:hypothetical protein n=1 Tax=Vibrio genomosp. F10 TaxID=723171 RepID=UPI000300E49F|nr:hypothetical protein [Vibrio genomosp. F10]OEF07615.1 hypothetical protein A1QI_05010 [Vibrio genomosp. F10 str. 9ZB36]
MAHHDINNDQDLRGIFGSSTSLAVGDTVSINHINVGVTKEPVVNVSPGNPNQADVIELKSTVCIQKYKCPINKSAVIIIFDSVSPVPAAKVLYLLK